MGVYEHHIVFYYVAEVMSRLGVPVTDYLLYWFDT